MRRFFAAATCLAMLHLSLVGGDLACATHGVHRVASATREDTAMPDHDAMHHASGDRQSSDCPTPSLPHCCDALAACGPAIALGSGVTDMPTVSAPFGLPHAIASPLISRSRGPEPPPPKA
jgi:hypothetical protein